MLVQVKSKTIITLVALLFTHLCHLFAQDSLVYGAFGTVHLYHPKTPPKSLMLFISGDGGWELGVVGMAKTLADQGALVAGVDAKKFKSSMAKQNEGCHYPAAAFEDLSMMLQKKLKFPTYQKPILVGYSYGATLLYGMLAQAPAGTFKGGIALGFCPDIEISKPLCKGSGLISHVLKPGKSYYLDKVEKLSAPFIVLNGKKDQICNYASTAAFIKGMGNAELVALDKVGHGFSVTKDWEPQFHLAFQKVMQSTEIANPHIKTNTDLPLEIYEPKGKSNSLVFMLSGDGGWTSFDHEIANSLVSQGKIVLGMDSQKYFWKAKTPAQASADISKVLWKYLEANPNLTISLVGYSFGAGVAPFIANRFPQEVKKALKSLVLISADEVADFEIHISDMLNFGSKKQPYKVLDEFHKTTGLKKLCIFGSDEDEAVSSKFKGANTTVVILPGGHHYNNDFRAIADRISKL